MNSFTCLLVDDDPDDHEFFNEHIKGVSPSINCISTFNGKDAMDKLLSGAIRPDAIFLDLNMPIVDGNQFLLEVKSHERLKEIPVVILSTSGNQQNRREAKEAGAIAFMAKPYKLADWDTELKRIFKTYFPSVF